MPTPCPSNERERLAALIGYQILDTPPEQAFDEIVSLAAMICGTPIAMVSLVDESRQWFKSKLGVDVRETPREIAFCAHVVAGSEILIVPDARKDERFANNPLVLAAPHVRFYAGVPLVCREGFALGAICVIDRIPRELSEVQKDALEILARQVMDQIELQRQLRERKAAEDRLLRLNRVNALLIQFNGAMVGIRDRNELFDTACRIGVATGKMQSTWIGVIDRASGELRMAASAGEEIICLNGIRVSDDPLVDDGPVGFVIREGKHLIWNGIGGSGGIMQDSSNDSCQPCKRNAAAVFPLRDSDGVFGIFALFVDVCGFFDQDEVRLLDQLATDISYAVESIDQQELRWKAEAGLVRSNRALQLMCRCNSASVHSETEAGLVEATCRTAIETGAFSLAWVGYLETHQEQSVVSCAHSEPGGAALPAIQFTASGGEKGQPDALVQAIQSGKPVLVPDLEHGGMARPWADFEREMGFIGVICLPLAHQTEIFGVLVLYFSRPMSVLDEEVGSLQNLADDLALGIVNHRAAAERAMIHEAVLTMARSISARSGGDFFEKLAHGAVAALGADACLISRFDPEKNRASTLCALVDGKWAHNFEYDLSDQPCAHLPNDIFVVRENAMTRFPKAKLLLKLRVESYLCVTLRDVAGNPIGTMSLLFRQPLVRHTFIASTLVIFGARAAGELERQKSDALLREQAALLDKARDAILVHDFEYRVSYWNLSAERLYGWTATEAVGRLSQPLIQDATATLAVAMETTLAKGEWTGEIEQRNKDGRPLTVEARWSLVRDDAGKPKSILAINTDITERKQLEQQFLRAQRMEGIGTLAGGIAHDINNVLCPIMMSIDLLRMYVEDPDALKIIDVVGASARRGAEMVKQVLAFARGVEGRSEEIEIQPIIDDLVHIIDETFPKNIRVETELRNDLWRIRADATQIHQVLLNLCVNARDAIEKRGEITLRAQNMLIGEQDSSRNIGVHPGPYLVIEVEDNGSGIPPAIIGKIFDPFFSTKELDKGSGLGLSSVHAIMKGHGGFVHVFSEPGAGTRFRLYLPALTDPGWASVECSETALPRGNGETVMVVDDEVFVREIASQTLEAFGYHVILAANGSEAVSSYVKHRDRIAVVLTDMMMPVMDGPATIRALRGLNPAIKIIGASGGNARKKVASATNAGVSHFLPKPYTTETLLKAIRAILEEKPLHDASGNPHVIA